MLAQALHHLPMFGFNALDLFGGQFVAPGASLAAAEELPARMRACRLAKARSNSCFFSSSKLAKLTARRTSSSLIGRPAKSNARRNSPEAQAAMHEQGDRAPQLVGVGLILGVANRQATCRARSPARH